MASTSINRFRVYVRSRQGDWAPVHQVPNRAGRLMGPLRTPSFLTSSSRDRGKELNVIGKFRIVASPWDLALARFHAETEVVLVNQRHNVSERNYRKAIHNGRYSQLMTKPSMV